MRSEWYDDGTVAQIISIVAAAGRGRRVVGILSEEGRESERSRANHVSIRRGGNQLGFDRFFLVAVFFILFLGEGMVGMVTGAGRRGDLVGSLLRGRGWLWEG